MKDDNSKQEPGHDPDKDDSHDHTTEIIVNGRSRQVAEKELTFVEVVKLAFDDAVFNEVTVYTITYKRGEGHRPEGTLVEGETVKIKKGMIFNVKRTDKS